MNREGVLEIDLRKTDGRLSSLRDTTLQKLNGKALYKSNLLYRGFDSRFVEHILAWGTESHDDFGIYALPEYYLSIEPDPRWSNPLSYAMASGALAVYDGDKLRIGSGCCDWYEFIDQTRKNEAVVAVVQLKGLEKVWRFNTYPTILSK